MVEASVSTLEGPLGPDDSAEIPKLNQAASKDASVKGKGKDSDGKEDKLNSTDAKSKDDVADQGDQYTENSANPVVNDVAQAKDLRSPTSPGAGMRTSQKTDILAMQSIANIKVNVQAILGGIQMPVSQLVDIKQGELISLDSNVGEAIDIIANGQLIARGEIVVIEEGVPRFGITLTEII